MKKIIISVLIMLLFSCNLNTTKNFSLLDYFNGDYTSYSKEYVNNKSIDLGFCYMNNFRISQNIIVGESIKIKDLEVASALKDLQASVVKTETLQDNTIIIYAYTKLINSTKQVDNKNVNLQFAITPHYVVVGWPLILGSY